jgi:hypothetical protein
LSFPNYGRTMGWAGRRASKFVRELGLKVRKSRVLNARDLVSHGYA